jgi:hypothetical protein
VGASEGPAVFFWQFLRPWDPEFHGLLLFGSKKMKIKPSLAEFKKMARQGNLIPICREFLADTETPVSAYLKLRDDSYSKFYNPRRKTK